MRCKRCDYPLWNLDARLCPECGAAFRPSEHEFVPRSVVFQCPNCRRTYFGTDAHGHLDPKAFNCTGCGHHIHMDEMIVAPREGVAEDRAAPDHMPWLERGETGAVRAWFSSMRWAMVEPQRFIRATPSGTSTVAAWFFALCTITLYLAVGFLAPYMVFQTMMAVGSMGGGVGAIWFYLGRPAGYAAAIVILGLYPVIWAASAHGLLRLTGATPGGFRRTCHSVYYASSAAVLIALPCVGWLVGLIWWVVSATNMIKESQRAHGGRAALAVLAWPTLSIFLWVTLYVAVLPVMLLGMRGLTTAMGAVGPGVQSQTRFIAQAIVAESWQRSGTAPDHAVELLLSNWTTMIGDFCESGTRTTTVDIPLGAGTLQDFSGLSRSDQLGAVKAAIDGLPPNVVAYRFGDYVFTYPGATFNTGGAGLWVVVMLPDPDVNPAPAPTDSVFIGIDDYTVSTTTVGQLPARTRTQNQYRATLGLPPLPDLTKVTHDQPAVSADTTSTDDATPTARDD